MLRVASFLAVASAASVEDGTQLMQATVAVDGTVENTMEELKQQLKEELKTEIIAELKNFTQTESELETEDDASEDKVDKPKKKKKSKKKSTSPAPAPVAVYSGPTCEEQCASKGYTCGACSSTNCGSTWGHPSCAMGCHIGFYSTRVEDCEAQCNDHDGMCNWFFLGTVITNCASADTCPNQDRGKSSKEECKVGCQQRFDGHHQNGPRNSPQEIIDELNKIRASRGVGPATYKVEGEECATKAANYNVVHGGHKCGIDGLCSNCGWRAAGDFYANDKVDAVDRAFESRWHEGHKSDVCDETSHCGAVLIYNRIAIGTNDKVDDPLRHYKNNYYTIYYYDN